MGQQGGLFLANPVIGVVNSLVPKPNCTVPKGQRHTAPIVAKQVN
jgi:hypothetical protein